TGGMSAATISTPASSTGSVTVTWTAQATLPGNTANDGAITYVVERRVGSGSYAAIAAGGCAGTRSAPRSNCVDTPGATGSYSYRVVARYRTWTATSASASTS